MNWRQAQNQDQDQDQGELSFAAGLVVLDGTLGPELA